MRKRKLRSLQADETGVIIISAIVLIGAMLVAIWLISTIAGAIIPLVIFLILAIILALIVKKVLFGGKSLGIISGIFGAGKEAGRETVGMMKGARSEYQQYRKKEGGW